MNETEELIDQTAEADKAYRANKANKPNTDNKANKANKPYRTQAAETALQTEATSDGNGAASDHPAITIDHPSAPGELDTSAVQPPDCEHCKYRYERELCQSTCKRNFWTTLLQTVAKVAGVVLAAFGLSSFDEKD